MSKVIVKMNGSLQTQEISIQPHGNTKNVADQDLSLHSVSFDPPINGTVYGALLNYKGELNQLCSKLYEAPYNKPPVAPVLYIKPKNTITGTNMPIPLPTDTYHLQMGAALAVVIGKTTTKITEEDALDSVLGYTIANDVSIPHKSYFRPAIKQKARDGFCPIGPWIVKREDLTNPNSLAIKVFINGECIQENTTKNLVRPVEKLLSEISQFMTLYEGDTVLVGVPENPPLAIKGDKVRIEIEHIGFIENTVLPEEECFLRGHVK